MSPLIYNWTPVLKKACMHPWNRYGMSHQMRLALTNRHTKQSKPRIWRWKKLWRPPAKLSRRPQFLFVEVPTLPPTLGTGGQAVPRSTKIDTLLRPKVQFTTEMTLEEGPRYSSNLIQIVSQGKQEQECQLQW